MNAGSGAAVATRVTVGMDLVDWRTDTLVDLLRRRAAGELVNAAELDWPNIAEEIESVGSEQRHAVESLLMQALLHRLKIEAWPLSRDVPHWQAEARGVRDDAAARFAPSMRERLDLAQIYRRALRRMPDTMDGQPPLPVPAV